MDDLSQGETYANFRAWVPRNVLPVLDGAKSKNWVYYQWGPFSYPEPLVMLHALPGSADIFFNQIIELAPKGYWVLLIEIPKYNTMADFVDGFQLFLDMLNIKKLHIYGAGLGGFLAMHFAAARPEKVKSIALTHSFCSNERIIQHMHIPSFSVPWCPDFVLRSMIMSTLPRGQAELHAAMAAEFMIVRIHKLDRDTLISRLLLALTPASLTADKLRISDEQITFIDDMECRNGNTVIASLCKDLNLQFPQAKQALIRDAGEFPFVTKPDEVSMHLLVHMRRNAPVPTETLEIPHPARARIPKPEENRREKEQMRRAKHNPSVAKSTNNAAPATGTHRKEADKVTTKHEEQDSSVCIKAPQTVVDRGHDSEAVQRESEDIPENVQIYRDTGPSILEATKSLSKHSSKKERHGIEPKPLASSSLLIASGSEPSPPITETQAAPVATTVSTNPIIENPEELRLLETIKAVDGDGSPINPDRLREWITSGQPEKW